MAVAEQETGETQVSEAVQAKFAEVFGGGDEQSTPEVSETRSRASTLQREQEEQESLASLEGAEPEDAGAEADHSLEEGQSDAAEDQVTEEVAEEQTPASTGSTLDPVLRHAAKRNGWEDSEIDELVKANPGIADRTFRKLHKSYSDLSAQFAKVGQAKKQQGKPAAEEAEAEDDGEVSAADDLLSRIYGGDKAKEYADRYGEEFLDDVVKPLAGPMGKMLEYIQKQEMQAQDTEVLGFFKTLPSDLAEVYGTTPSPSEEQRDARSGLAQLADQIRSGAELQGVHMSLSDALGRAVSMHATDRLQTIERKRLTKQVQKRSSGLTARPTHRTGTAESGRKPGDEAAIESYKRKAAEIGMTF